MKIIVTTIWTIFIPYFGLVVSCTKPVNPSAASFKLTDSQEETEKILGASVSPCPPSEPKVNGAWGEWSACKRWSQARLCDNPAPRCGGSACDGESVRECISRDAPSWCYDKSGKPNRPRKPTQKDAERCWNNNPDIPKQCIVDLLNAAFDDPALAGQYPDFNGKCGCKKSGLDDSTNMKGRPLFECVSSSGVKFNISPVKDPLPGAGVMIPPTDGIANYCMFDVSIGGEPLIGDRMTENCFDCHNPEDPESDFDPEGCPPAIKPSVIQKILVP